jgi:NodT family efflux transporter outer membrane factor (OMF) lipoprotein
MHRFAWTSLLAVTLLSACAVGPNFHRPAAPASDSYSGEALRTALDARDGAVQKFVPGQDIPAQWWTLFHSEALNAVIGEALKSNPDLQSAEAAVRVALEDARAQEGAFLPNLNGSFSASRQHDAIQPSPTLANFVSHFNLYAAQVAGTWSLDIWGRNRRALEALKAQAHAQQFQLEAAYLALTSGIAAAAVQEASLRGQIAATMEIIRAERESLDLLRKQLNHGQIAEGDVIAQAAALAQTEALLPTLQKQLQQQRHLLTALAGSPSYQPLSETFELASLELPADLPLSVPSRLVAQRPDVRTAEENMHAASAQIGVAIGDMLPNISISGNYGTTATSIDQLFQPFNGYWTLAGGVAQPIFEGGALLHKARAARASFDQASAQYRSSVNTAFQNVADALAAIQSDLDSYNASITALEKAHESLDIVRRKLDLGAVNYLALLSAEQAYQQALIAKIQAQTQRYQDTITLFQALGGGWWNRPAGAEVAVSDRAALAR